MPLDKLTDAVLRFIGDNPRLTVLSGAGCSTSSGIPDYRDDEGNWKHTKPVQFADFSGSVTTRKKYWARSYTGWSRVGEAKPNAAHHALAKLEQAQYIECLVTQNVDNLPRAAGSRNIGDLHGVLDKVRCLNCDSITSRKEVQERMARLNPEWQADVDGYLPDGDALLRQQDYSEFVEPDCLECGGIVKPDVVFFGEAVPRERVTKVSESIERSDALLVVGSSLMVFSGFQFARHVVAAGKPLGIVNRGKTRADDMATLRVGGDCSAILERVAQQV